ncbi:MAG: nitrilase-related carbon-nitrogen hydrolase [Nocardioides sp.]
MAPADPPIRVGLLQMQAVDSVPANLANAAVLVSKAAQAGARIVCLPELFATPYFCHDVDPANFAYAERLDGQTVETMRTVAKRHGVTIVAPIYECAPDGKNYNTAAVIHGDGTLAGVYRKSSIPRSVMSDWVSVEQDYFAPGDTGFRVFDDPSGIRVGIMICYDRHFPEAARVLALRGADLILVPAATGGPSRKWWDVELRAHAIANICYVAGVNRVGFDDHDVDRPFYYGASLIAAHDGSILASGSESTQDVVVADLDLMAMKRAREELGWLRDRRPDLYGDLTN